MFDDFRPQLNNDYREAGIVLLGNLDPDIQEDILAQLRNPKLVAMDTIALWIDTKLDTLKRTLEKIDIFFANDEEIRKITGEQNLIRASRRLQDMGPPVVVAKKGEHGALIFGRDFVSGVLAYPCENVVDPTGAGDSFAGGFLGYLDKVGSLDEGDIRQAAVYGSVMASFVIEDFGIDRLKTLSDKDIEKRYNSFQKLVSF